MKRFFFAGALALIAGGTPLAADLPQVPAPVPPFSWTGVYLGPDAGYGFGTSSWTAPPPSGSTGNFSTSGGLFGFTVGGNYQFHHFVLGIEADADWTSLSGSVRCTNPGGLPLGCQTNGETLATVRGRAGFAWDRILFYGTGGAAFGNVQAGSSATAAFDSGLEAGWTAGAGIEAAIAPNWSVKVEYLYVDLGSLSCNVNCAASTSVSFTENVIRAGVNYQFGWGY